MIKYLNSFGYWYDNIYKHWYCARIPTFCNAKYKAKTEQEILSIIEKFSKSI